MADVTSVAITSGIPSSGTGTVRTIGAMFLSSNVQTTIPSATSVSAVATAASNNETNISTASVRVHGVHLYNNNSSSPVFLKLYNLSTAPTAGTAALLFNIGVSPGAVRDVSLLGMLSSIGLGYTTTLGITSTSTTAVAANDLVGVIEYSTGP